MEPFLEQRRAPFGFFGHEFEAAIQRRDEPCVMAPLHYHDMYEVLYSIQGRCRLTLSNRVYDFGPGDMVMYDPMLPHTVISFEKQTQYLYMKFQKNLLYSDFMTPAEQSILLTYEHSSEKHKVFFASKMLEDTQIPALLMNTYHLWVDKEFGYQMAIRAGILFFFDWVLKSWYHSDEGVQQILYDYNPSITQLTPAFSYISEHLCEEMSMQDAAEHCRLPYWTFSRLFGRCTGQHFSEYILRQRIKKAELLLKVTDEPITQIAVECGFATSSHFTAQFKRVCGVTPLKYRKGMIGG